MSYLGPCCYHASKKKKKKKQRKKLQVEEKHETSHENCYSETQMPRIYVCVLPHSMKIIKINSALVDFATAEVQNLDNRTFLCSGKYIFC